MIVIYEQEYDIVSILDVIEDDKFEDYVEYYRQMLLNKPDYLEIIDEKDNNLGQDRYYNFKIKLDFNNYPEEWYGFYYVVFDDINNFQNE